MANNAATIQTPQIVTTVVRHVGYDDTRMWKEFTVTLYPWMLSTAKGYTDRPTDKRQQHGRNMHIKLRSTPVPDILFAQAWHA
jgi:hypothetical protein